MNIQGNINSALNIAAFLVSQSPLKESSERRSLINKTKKRLNLLSSESAKAEEKFEQAYVAESEKLDEKGASIEEYQALEDRMPQMKEWLEAEEIDKASKATAQELFELDPSVETARILAEHSRTVSISEKERAKSKEAIDTRKAKAEQDRLNKEAEDQARQAESKRIRELILSRGKE